MSADRVCIIGCITRGEHRDDCTTKDAETFPCRGCRPRLARHMAYVCDGCYHRFGKMLKDAPDLLARLVSLDDPSRATPTDVERIQGTPRAVAPAPTDDDRLDARVAIEANITDWAIWAEGDDMAKLPVSMQAAAVVDRIDDIVNDRDRVSELAEAVLIIHKPNGAGVRDAWSIRDAVQKWGVERRADKFVYPDDDPEDEESMPVREWYDPLLTVAQAAKRHDITQRAVQKWVAKGLIEPVTKSRGPRGSVLSFFRASEIDRVKQQMDAARHAGKAA